jgi:hypothetical protein
LPASDLASILAERSSALADLEAAARRYMESCARLSGLYALVSPNSRSHDLG